MTTEELAQVDSVASPTPAPRLNKWLALGGHLVKYIDKAISPFISWWREVVEATLSYEVVETKAPAIKRILRPYSLERAITEYIWNGFDANATKVEVEFQRSESGKIRKIVISDNGGGIEKEELLKKFKPFYETEKELVWEANKNHSVPHGRSGVGRLTFFKFATRAKWMTVYERKGAHFEYEILIDENNLHKFKFVSEPKEVQSPCGTVVEFEGIDKSLNEKETREEAIQYIKNEFAWFIELKSKDKFQLLIDKEPFDRLELVEETESGNWEVEGSRFSFKYIQWKNTLNDEGYKFYFLDSKGEERYKDFTGFNRHGDDFYHSLYFTSPYFDTFSFVPVDEKQSILGGEARSGATFKRLMDKAEKYLKSKRKPFLRTRSRREVETYQDEGVIPKTSKDEFEKLRVSYLTQTLEELYVVEPRIFYSLNLEQKKAMVGFLQLLLDTDERERVLDVVSQLVELEPEERNEFSRLLRKYKLSYIIDLTHMIDERRKKVALLRHLVYEADWCVKEKEVQALIEEITWVFGEQYALLGGVDDNFEVLLRRIWKKVHTSDEEPSMTGPDKHKQPDVLLCREQKKPDEFNFVIIELKAPDVNIGDTQLEQIKKYARIVREEPQFNSDKFSWDFILIGRDFSESSNLEADQDGLKQFGEKGLIQRYAPRKQKVYVKRWADILAEFELRHQFLFDKLNESKQRIISEGKAEIAALGVSDKHELQKSVTF